MLASPHPRRDGIAEFDARIARAEATRTRFLRDLNALSGLGPDARRAGVLLRMVVRRLEHLARSREALLGGERAGS